MVTWSKLVMSLGLLAFAACSGGQFSGNLVGRDQSDKQEDDGDIVANDEVSRQKQAEAELEATDDPQQVAGSFLTMECAEDPALPHDEMSVSVGCVVKHDDGSKADMSQATHQEWSLLSPLNLLLPTKFTDAVAGVLSHKVVMAPRALLPLHSVRATFNRDGIPYDLAAPIRAATQGTQDEDAVGDDSAKPTAPEVVEVGQTEDFQIGDDAWDTDRNQGCAARLQAVAISGSRISSVIRVTSATAKVAVMLKDICGATTKANYVRIMRGNTVLKETKLKPYADSLAIAAMDLAQGEYQLVIESRRYSIHTKDIDDFVVGRIMVVAEGAVSIDRPTAP